MSEKKQASNRRNARQSTGPKTVAGKETVSQNARRHGILSTHLVLEDESREKFDLLLATLQQEMQPVGLIEQTLVERVAVSIWRQRRLVRAESAEVELKQRMFIGKDLLMAANSLGISSSDRRLRDAMNFPHMPPIENGSEEIGLVLAQLLKLSLQLKNLTYDDIQECFPLAYNELLQTADGTRVGLNNKVETRGIGLAAYLSEFIAAYRQMYDHERIKELVYLYRGSAQVRASVDLIGRYQSALDNELYKAMRALREAQSWRLSRLEASVHRVNGEVG